jgi:hypothetical protein
MTINMKKTTRSRKPETVLPDPGISAADLRQRWSRFDDREAKAIRSRRDAVRLVQAKYGLDKDQAQTNVDVWAAGRVFAGDAMAGV